MGEILKISSRLRLIFTPWSDTPRSRDQPPFPSPAVMVHSGNGFLSDITDDAMRGTLAETKGQAISPLFLPFHLRVSPPWRWFWGTVLLLGLGAYAWEEHLEQRFIPTRWGTVVPGRIYRSGQVSQYLIESQLQQHKIQVVIDLTDAEPENPDQQAEQAAVAALNIQHHRLPLFGDGSGEVETYIAAVALLREAELAGQPVLVHCSAGAQRTGGVVAFYRLLFQQREPGEVSAEILRYAGNRRNPLLFYYVNDHLDEVAAGLVQRGLLSEVPDPLPQLPR